MSDWKSRSTKITEDSSSGWKSRAIPQDSSTQQEEIGPSELESLLRGMGQSATYGFADEATAALESLLSDKTYEQSRAESREAYKKAQEANPAAYLGGEIGGAIASSFIPGIGQIGAAGKAATLGGKVLAGAKAGATMGALTGLGTSEADSLPEMAQDVGEGTLLGGAIGGALPVAAKGLSTVGKGLQKVTGKAADWAGDTVGKWVDSNSELTKLKKIFEKSKEGLNLDVKKTEQELTGTSKEVVDTLQNLLKEKGQDINKVAEFADEALANNPKLNIKDIITGLKKQKVSPNTSERLSNEIDDLLTVLENKALSKTEERLVAAGPVKAGTTDKALNKVKKQLIKTKKQLERELQETQINILKSTDKAEVDAHLARFEELKSALNDIEVNPSVVSKDGVNFVEGILKKPKTAIKETIKAGPVVKGTVDELEKNTKKLTDTLVTEKAKLQSQLKEVLAAFNSRKGELTPELEDQLFGEIGKINKAISDIDTQLTQVSIPDMNRDALSAVISKPQITDDLAILKGKSIAAPIPEELTGSYTPVAFEKEASVVPGKSIVEPLPEKEIGSFTPLKKAEVDVIGRPELSSLESRELQADLYEGIPRRQYEAMSTAGRKKFDEIMAQVKAGVSRGDISTEQYFDEANNAYSQLKKIIEDVGIKGRNFEEIIPGKELGETLADYKKIASMIEETPDWKYGKTARQSRESMNNFLNRLEEVAPAEAKRMGTKMEDIAERHELAREIAKPRLLGSKDPISFVLGGLQGIAYKGAKTAGSIARTLGELTPDQTMQLANAYTGHTKQLLTRIAENDSPQTRKALIFTALQRPEFRKDLGITEDEGQ